MTKEPSNSSSRERKACCIWSADLPSPPTPPPAPPVCNKLVPDTCEICARNQAKGVREEVASAFGWRLQAEGGAHARHAPD